MSNKIDLTYLKGRVFTKFIPETPEGEEAWNEMCEQGECVVSVWNAQLPSVLRQIRKAGYVVRKAKPSTMTDEELLAEFDL